jgi:hypothetical protein
MTRAFRKAIEPGYRLISVLIIFRRTVVACGRRTSSICDRLRANGDSVRVWHARSSCPRTSGWSRMSTRAETLKLQFLLLDASRRRRQTATVICRIQFPASRSGAYATTMTSMREPQLGPPGMMSAGCGERERGPPGSRPRQPATTV